LFWQIDQSDPMVDPGVPVDQLVSKPDDLGILRDGFGDRCVPLPKLRQRFADEAAPEPEDQFSKVLVGGDENPILGDSELKGGFVINSRRALLNAQNVMATEP
jgi:hypothetical protein